MNTLLIKIRNLGIASLGLLMLGSCSDILDEQPRTKYDPSFFGTEEGIEGGLTALYSHLRDTYGYAYYYNICETGTDEYTYGHDADGNFKDADLSGVGSLTSQSCRADALWNNVFTYINSASGIIENGMASGMDESLISEARFFRAFDYFRLVQTFGGVPLDLGAGELKFNTSPSRVSKRNTVPEVYTKAIFPDLITAVTNLPETGRVTGGLTKTAARLVLAQAYLTYGWWLENPKDIPTYPVCDRVDPDGHDAQWYFQKAYDIALEGIQNPGPFALQPTFYDVNVGSNDRNNEMVLYADHTENSEEFNGGSLSYGSGSAPDNFAGWMVTWNYPNMTATRADNGAKFTPVLRAATQNLGRPWTRMAPPQEVFYNTFADKTHDSRYDGTFTTVLRANWDLDQANYGTLTHAKNANDSLISVGDAVLSFLDSDVADQSKIKYVTDNSVGGGVMEGRVPYRYGWRCRLFRKHRPIYQRYRVECRTACQPGNAETCFQRDPCDCRIGQQPGDLHPRPRCRRTLELPLRIGGSNRRTYRHEPTASRRPDTVCQGNRGERKPGTYGLADERRRCSPRTAHCRPRTFADVRGR